ncbi:kinase-like domain-containing protein, partial [Gigaspora rosea]
QSYYGTCKSCKQHNTFYDWCQTCDPKTITQGWSNSVFVDDIVKNCIKEFQSKAIMHDDVIEWIPFAKLDKIEKIGEGGFGSVYSAIWLDGIRVTKYNNNKWVRSRENPSKVALKTLSNPHDLSKCLKEFKNHTQCRLMGSELAIYGLTKSTKKIEDLEGGVYLMVLQFADSGSLNKFLENKFKELTWERKLSQLIDISNDLVKIHKAGYTHSDFHSGNILQNKIDGSIFSYIADLGLSKKIEEH